MTLLTVAFFGCSDQRRASGPEGQTPVPLRLAVAMFSTLGERRPGRRDRPDDTGTPPPEDAAVVVLPIAASEDAWDMAYLASIPASAHLNGDRRQSWPSPTRRD